MGHVENVMNSPLYCNLCRKTTPSKEWDCTICGFSKPYKGSDMEETNKAMYELIMEIYKAPCWVNYDTSRKVYQIEVDKSWFKRVEELKTRETE